MPIHRQIFYGGRVQGVGFRYSVRHIAAGYEVVGAVKNLPDGRVELRASGELEEVQAFLDAIKASHLRTHIRTVDEADAPEPPPGASGFHILA